MDWVAEIDIRDFFDSINIERLCNMLKKARLNNGLYQLIHRYLYPIVQYNDFQRKRKTKGIIQGSPISPILSNLYMQELDNFLENKYSFCRFSDNIYVYCKTEKEALEAIECISRKLSELGLCVNIEKTGAFASITRTVLGFQFYRQNGKGEVLVKHRAKETKNYFRSWHHSVIQKVDKNYHILNDGILTRKDYTLLFENENKKHYLPVETCGMLNIYSNVAFTSGFFEFAKKKELKISLYDKYGTYVGCFVAASHFLSTKTLLKQVTIYNNLEKRLAIAKKIELASLHNQRENLRYTKKHRAESELVEAIEVMSEIMKQMKQCKTIEELMLLEARAKQRYLQAFDIMIADEEFRFEKKDKATATERGKCIDKFWKCVFIPTNCGRNI